MIMLKLGNNEDGAIGPGLYAFSTTGALHLQWFRDGAFVTLTDGVFAGATDDLIELPSSRLKVINAGSETITLSQVRR